MCQVKVLGEKPAALKDGPDACLMEPIRKFHGEVTVHTCVAHDRE